MPNTDLVEKDTDVAITSSLPTAPTDFKSSDESACENCHQPIYGPFCAQCGQKAESTLKYFWVVIMHLLDDIFSFDSRASRTILPLIIRPGFLTNEYIAGRRVHYVPPLRLYLFISIVFFITLQFIVTSENNNILNINDNKTVISDIKEHIDLLEGKQLSLKQNHTENQENTEGTERLLAITHQLATLSTFIIDLNKDYTVTENKALIDMTRRLVSLELEKIDDEPLSDKDKDRYDLLITNIAKVKNGESIDEIDKVVTFGNNKDVSISFDFLSEDSNKKLAVFAETLTNKAQKAFNSDTTPLVQEAISKLPQLMFILLPIFACLLKIMFLFSKRLYMEHLTVALHSHSFIFITILLVQLLDIFDNYSETKIPFLSGTVQFAASALMIWMPIYLFLMQKRVYKQGYFFTFLKFTFIGSAYMLLIILTGVIAFIWGLTDI
ncbi:MAG: DUF3667 domain-containing protein [Colwellia sp.]|nr:DUF3667 domain-containing protein [Colwellia sp.]